LRQEQELDQDEYGAMMEGLKFHSHLKIKNVPHRKTLVFPFVKQACGIRTEKQSLLIVTIIKHHN
jgi:hypothetical protein